MLKLRNELGKSDFTSLKYTVALKTADLLSVIIHFTCQQIPS